MNNGEKGNILVYYNKRDCTIMTKFTCYILDNGGMIIVKTGADSQRIHPNSTNHHLKEYETAAIEVANDATNELLGKKAHTLVQVCLLPISFIIAKLKSPYRGRVYCGFLGSLFCPCFLIRNFGLGLLL